MWYIQRIAIGIAALVVSHCCDDPMVSSWEVAGTFTLLEVKVEDVSGKADVYPHQISNVCMFFRS